VNGTLVAATVRMFIICTLYTRGYCFLLGIFSLLLKGALDTDWTITLLWSYFFFGILFVCLVGGAMWMGMKKLEEMQKKAEKGSRGSILCFLCFLRMFSRSASSTFIDRCDYLVFDQHNVNVGRDNAAQKRDNDSNVETNLNARVVSGQR